MHSNSTPCFDDGIPVEHAHLLALSTRAKADALLAAEGVMALSASMGAIAARVEDQFTLSVELEASSGNCTERVASLTSRAGQIGELAGMIDAIADYASILSINATIEAARCGEAGKTFAVVAGEFQSLAGQTREAAVKITSIIRSVRDEAGGAEAAMRAMSETIGKMNAATESIRDAVVDQRTGTQTIIMHAEETAEDVAALAAALMNLDGAGAIPISKC